MRAFILAAALLAAGCSPPEGTPERAAYDNRLRSFIQATSAANSSAPVPQQTTCMRVGNMIDCTTRPAY